MKKFKMLMMAVATLTSPLLFGQVVSNNQLVKLNSEKTKYTCPMHPNMQMDNLYKCEKLSSSLNLSLKEKMKWEEMKRTGLMNTQASSYLPCSVSRDYNSLNISPKEKMKWESMRISNSFSESNANAAYICRKINVLKTNKQYDSSILNLSPKEKMKRKLMKI